MTRDTPAREADFQAERLAKSYSAENRFAGNSIVTLNTLRSGYHFYDPPRIGSERTVTPSSQDVDRSRAWKSASPPYSHVTRTKKLPLWQL
ncbi:hypothetical protein [Brevibacillus reuszeri]|uniref:hypothetical protein n=1 Tax=Brevibacillus reuszeri TaxID=54915 RepID=UPI0013E04374|nr:hypothetical protein [Brevibacillus reuszeri]